METNRKKKQTLETCSVSLTDTRTRARSIRETSRILFLSLKVSWSCRMSSSRQTHSRKIIFLSFLLSFETHGDKSTARMEILKYYFLKMRHFDCIAVSRQILRLASFAAVINRANSFKNIIHQMKPFTVRTWTSHASSIHKTHALYISSCLRICGICLNSTWFPFLAQSVWIYSSSIRKDSKSFIAIISWMGDCAVALHYSFSLETFRQP